MTKLLLVSAAVLTFSLTAATAQTPPSTQTAPSTPGNSAPGATSVTPMQGVSPSTGVTPGTGVVDRNTGTAAASGDRNQAVTTTTANAPEPARGASSYTESQARGRLEEKGFIAVTGLVKDDDGVWRGTAQKGGTAAQVWMDYKGNIGEGTARPAAVPR